VISNLVRRWEKAMNVSIDAWFAVVLFGLIVLWRSRSKWISKDDPPTKDD
jgi:hypothetical protein